MENQESLPKPELDLPLPETEIPAQAPSAASKKLAGKTILAIAVVFLILLTAGVSLAYFLAKNSASNKQVACTMEAKLCPDGSSVGRTGPKCEFSVCPKTTPSPTSDPTANWKTFNSPNEKAYTSTNGNITFKYPQDWTTAIHADLIRLLPPGVSDTNVQAPTNGDYINFQSGTFNPEECRVDSQCPTIDSTSKSIINGKSVNITNGHIYGYRFEDITFNSNGIYYNFSLHNSDLSSLPIDKIQILLEAANSFKYTDQTSPTPGGQSYIGNGCKIGGCGGEICQDASSEPIATPCIYKASFACYKSARCEVQQNGKCAWTQTADLTSCLISTK